MARTPTNRTHKLRQPIPDGNFYPIRPRTYQKPLIQAFTVDPVTKRPRSRHGVCVWHRRSGKDATAMLGIAMPAMAMRPGNYFHIFPFYAQAKRAIWQEEQSFLDRIPPHWDPHRLGTEMFVELTIPGGKRKARYFLLGADDADTVSRLVGTNPLGVIYSEAAQIDKSVRALLRPALAANGGWELFVSTPRGKNWFYELYRMAQQDPTWFTSFLTVDDTRKDAVEEDGRPVEGEDGGPVIPPEEIEADRKSGISEEEIQQEYYCSWEGYAVGSIYGEVLRQARADRRIGLFPYDPRWPVGVMFDIGRTDLTSAWFYQQRGSAILFIDYWASRGETSSSAIRFLKERKPYHYGKLFLPHDAKERRFQRPESVEDEFSRWFRCPVIVANQMAVTLGLNAVRQMFPRFHFHEPTCGIEQGKGIPSGLDSLGNYARRFDREKKDYAAEPLHDIHSHGADALRTGMAAWEEGLEFPETIRDGSQIPVETQFEFRMPTLGGRW